MDHLQGEEFLGGCRDEVTGEYAMNCPIIGHLYPKPAHEYMNVDNTVKFSYSSFECYQIVC